MSEQLNTDSLPDPAVIAAAAGDPPADPPAPAEADTPPAPQPRMIPAEKLVEVVTPLRSQLRERENELAQTRRRLAEQDALLERLQQRAPDPNAAPTPPQPRQDRPPDPSDIDRRAAELLFQRDAQAISEAAYRAYGQQWVDSLNLLNTFGLNTGDFVNAVMEVVGRDSTHAVMHAIAQQPEKAATLASMSPARRIAEITRMSADMTAKSAAPAAPPAPPPRTVSRAPAPPPPVDAGGTGKVVPPYDDSLSDEEFTAQFNEAMRRRSARR